MTFKQYLENSIGQIDESGAGITRVLKRLEDNTDFAIVTAFRGSNTRKQNIANNNKLIKDIRAELGQQVGAYKLVGHWKECSVPLEKGETIKDCKGKITNALEESWMVIRPDLISLDRFENAIKKVAKKYDQDAYIIRKNGKLTLNGKDGEVWDDLGKANKDSISTGFERIVDIQGYSELKKDRVHGKTRHIIFEDFQVDLIVPKDNNFSKMLFEKANILY